MNVWRRGLNWQRVRKMGEKGAKMKTSSPGGQIGIDWCDMTVKCRCRWRWAGYGICAKCHDNLQHRGCGLSSTFLFFFWSVLTFSFVGMLFAWLAFSPYKHECGQLGCRPDNEGSWSIGFYRGSSPFSLQSIEMVSQCFFNSQISRFLLLVSM